MAAKKKNPATHTPVESIVHEDTRVNIPTADAHDLVTDDVQQITQLRYPRNIDHDPQLVWRGKDEQDNEDLFVDVPPIYIQEKVDPRVIIENLRDTTKKPEDEPELTLFDTFDGLDDMQSVEFYRHASNWSNRMILGDSLQTMASLSERESLRGKVQMIFMDPPYGIKFGSNWQVSMRNRTVGDKKTDVAREVEVVKAFRDTWEMGIHSYLTYLRDRMIIARDLLTESGSFFMQIGDENVHIVRSVMDEVFGASNFVSLVMYQKTSTANAAAGLKSLGAVADYIIWYAKDLNKMQYHQLYNTKSIGGAGATGYVNIELPDGSKRPLTAEEKKNLGLVPSSSRFFASDNLTSQTGTAIGKFPVEIGSKSYVPKNGVWKTNKDGMQRLQLAGRVIAGKETLSYLRYFDDFTAIPMNNVWTDATSRSIQDKVYVVQTSPTVIQRCLLMTTQPGDLVIDPTCGSGTTAFVAEQFGRRWITIDSSRVALAIAKQRLIGAKFPYYLLSDTEEGRQKEQQVSGKQVVGGNCKGDIRQGFVYQRVPHVTLGSIAQNPDIKPGMSKKEIDSVIAKNAEMEFLYDKPYENNKKVRVAGRFTIESLSPHRSLGFVQYIDGDNDEAAEAAEEFNETILRNLEKSGIQNGLKKERLKFESVEPYAGLFVQAVGVQESGDDTAGRKVAIAVGPQYGTVSPSFIKEATREAQQIDGVKMLCILGFAFDPAAVGVDADYEVVGDALGAVARETKLGKLAVVLVRMNTDLLMGDELKKTGAGNLFVVSGEPDIKISSTKDGQVTVEIKGVDVYDPNTDEIRSRSTEEIALWMIDTNYNGESFFVRHCYFPGGQDHYKQLRRALKSDIDEEAWESLNSVSSRAFGKPDTGKIAVKVINDYGDEVMKVFEV
jgi:adenine-specific DNA-methyltransferase